MTEKEVNASWEVRKIPIKSLKENPLNPNVQDAKTFEKLKRSLEKYGYAELITVVPHPEKSAEYLVASGNHRVRALKEKGWDKIPVLIVYEMNYPEALLASFAFNWARGKIDNKKAGELFLELEDEMGIDEIQDILGMSPKEYDEYTAALRDPAAEKSCTTDAVDPADVTKEFRGKKPDDFRRTLTIALNAEDYDLVMATLNQFESLSEGIVSICEFYRSKGGEQK